MNKAKLQTKTKQQQNQKHPMKKVLVLRESNCKNTGKIQHFPNLTATSFTQTEYMAELYDPMFGSPLFPPNPFLSYCPGSLTIPFILFQLP